jgi:trk system potassium uptake protein TrkA
MKLIVVGCGRIGSELALAVAAKGHTVSVIDKTSQTFVRLGTGFPGRTIAGNLLDQDVLLRAGIKEADGLAAVTPDDATNFVVARAAKEIFQVPNVVARVYDPLRREAFEEMGIRVTTSSSWGAQRITQLLTHPEVLPILTLGHGEILLVEVRVKGNLSGMTIATLQQKKDWILVAVIRKGKAEIPIPETVLYKDDMLILGVPAANLDELETLKLETKEA